MEISIKDKNKARKKGITIQEELRPECGVK